jgi:hypothetical protein
MVEPERAGGALVVARDERLRRLRRLRRPRPGVWMYIVGLLVGGALVCVTELGRSR